MEEFDDITESWQVDFTQFSRGTCSWHDTADHFASFVYVLDVGTAIIPVSFAGLSPMDVGPFTSLDFAIRFFEPYPSFNEWHLREEKTMHASNARTFQDVNIRDKNGRLVANMTQQCLLRPKKPSTKIWYMWDILMNMSNARREKYILKPTEKSQPLFRTSASLYKKANARLNLQSLTRPRLFRNVVLSRHLSGR